MTFGAVERGVIEDDLDVCFENGNERYPDVFRILKSKGWNLKNLIVTNVEMKCREEKKCIVISSSNVNSSNQEDIFHV